MSKAAVSVVKLDNIIISSDTNHNSNFYSRGKRVLRSRIQLREEIKKTSAATERLKEASCEATHELARLSFISDNGASKNIDLEIIIKKLNPLFSNKDSYCFPFN